jgi:DNA-binding response OmpR family regulator
MSITKRILIVEDDPKVAKAMTIRLMSAGYKVLAAEDGVRGLQLAEDQKPDLIITDIWMPAGVGFAMVYRLKQLASEIPIIFMSASKDPGLRRHAVDFGAVAFLEKPYTPELLLELVACAFNRSHSTTPPARAATAAPAAKTNPRTQMKKVLVVEDDPKIALALTTRLKGAGYQASIAPDAITGVNMAVKLQPDLIILDISMPAGSGFDVAERVQNLVPKLMPIIFLTASKQAGLRRRAMELGAAGFFEKPYKGEELLAAVDAALGEPASLFAQNTTAKN